MLVINLVDRADVGVIQGRGSFGLTLEAGQSLGIFGYVIRQEFKRNEAIQLNVLRLIDHPHPAAAQLLDDAVMRNGLADHWRGSYVCETGKSMKAGELAVSRKDCC